MSEKTISVELTRIQWQRILANLKQDIQQYDAEIVNVEIANMDSVPLYALQDYAVEIYNTIAGQCRLPGIIDDCQITDLKDHPALD